MFLFLLDFQSIFILLQTITMRLIPWSDPDTASSTVVDVDSEKLAEDQTKSDIEKNLRKTWEIRFLNSDRWFIKNLLKNLPKK